MQSIETHLIHTFLGNKHMNAFLKSLILHKYQGCFVTFTITSWLYLTLSLCTFGNSLEYRLNLLKLFFSSVHLGHRKDWGILISFDVRKKTGHLHLGNRTRWNWNEIKDACTFYSLTVVNQPSDTLSAMLDFFFFGCFITRPSQAKTAPAFGDCWLKMSHTHCLLKDMPGTQNELLNIAQRKYFLSDLYTLANKDLSGWA